MSTKTISASRLRSHLADALDSLNIDDVLVVTRRGKKEKAIIDLDKLEDLLESNDSELTDSIAKARKEIGRGEFFTHEEVFGDID